MHPNLRTLARGLVPALALGALLMQASAHAQTPPAAQEPPPMAHPCNHGHPPHGGHGPWHRREVWMKHFGITNAQRVRIHAILQRSWQEARPMHQQMRALGEQERKLFAAPTIDVIALQHLQHRRMRLMAHAAAQRLQTRIAIAEVLTAAQRQEMAQAWNRHQHGAWKRMRHPGPGGQPHPMPGTSALQ